MADDTQTLSWWTSISVHCTLCNNTHNTCIVMFDNCSVILGFGVQGNMLVVVFVHFKVYIGV